MKIFMIGAILFLIGYAGMNKTATDTNKEYLELLIMADDCEAWDGHFNYKLNTCEY